LFVSISAAQNAPAPHAHLLEQTKGGTRPHYVLNPWLDVLNARAAVLRAGYALTKFDLRIHDKIRGGGQPKTFREQEIAEHLTTKGWLHKAKEGFTAERPGTDLEAINNAIWLPNALVTGTAAGEVSPIARVRGYQEVMVLRLLVDLYHDQNLRDDGGISRRVLRQEWGRVRIGEQGIYTVWAFNEGPVWMNWIGAAECHKKSGGEPASDFWRRLKVLQQEGLVTFIPHLCESADFDAEVIHAYGTGWSPEGLQDPENEVGYAAYYAGYAMANDTELMKQLGDGRPLFAPVSRSYPEVQLVGIARLRYRPHTKRTAAWFRELKTNLPVHTEQYNKLRQKGDAARSRTVGA
jgi:hypothetical protein